jgi:hypothetical protein
MRSDAPPDAEVLVAWNPARWSHATAQLLGPGSSKLLL